jgi:hypothetical protein
MVTACRKEHIPSLKQWDFNGSSVKIPALLDTAFSHQPFGLATRKVYTSKMKKQGSRDASDFCCSRASDIKLQF